MSGTAARMAQVRGAVDLHLHTRASDGVWTPDALVDRVVAAGIGVMAVADHDTFAAVEPVVVKAAARGVAVVPGVELTTAWDGRQWHLLIYGADFAGTRLGDLVAGLRQRQVDAARQAIAALRRGGFDLPSLAPVIDGREPLPIYVMSALMRDKYANSHLAANEFVTRRLGIHFYFDVPLADAVEAAHAARGVAVLAHPGRSEPEALTAERLARLLDHAPIDGLEVFYPTHTTAQTAHFAELARHHGLVTSCGSDSHGPGRPRDPMAYPLAQAASLLELLGFPADGGER